MPHYYRGKKRWEEKHEQMHGAAPIGLLESELEGGRPLRNRPVMHFPDSPDRNAVLKSPKNLVSGVRRTAERNRSLIQGEQYRCQLIIVT